MIGRHRQGAITDDPFRCAGPCEPCTSAPTAIECNRNAPIWAGARPFSTLITGVIAALRCILWQREVAAGPVHSEFNSATSSVQLKALTRYLRRIVGEPASTARMASVPECRRSIFCTEKDAIRLQYAAVAHVHETGRQSSQHEAKRIH